MFTVWTNSTTVAYKTRPSFHPQYGLRDGEDEFTQETAYWYSPLMVAEGLTATQAEEVVESLEAAARLPGDRQRPDLERLSPHEVELRLAHRIAICLRADVEVPFFWVTPDGLTEEEAATARRTAAGNL
jgi:hypothetical protein